jgi:hypothetical protein
MCRALEPSNEHTCKRSSKCLAYVASKEKKFYVSSLIRPKPRELVGRCQKSAPRTDGWRCFLKIPIKPVVGLAFPKLKASLSIDYHVLRSFCSFRRRARENLFNAAKSCPLPKMSRANIKLICCGDQLPLSTNLWAALFQRLRLSPGR